MPDEPHLKTRFAFMVTRLLQIPFWTIFNMLPFIIYRDLHANVLQITLMMCLKPTVSLISLYWSAPVHQRRDRLRSNIVWANVLKHLPFLLYPFVDNVWFFVFSFGLYMTLKRGVIPAWMEVFKLNIPGISREKVFAYGSAIDYLGCAILPLLFGWVFDDLTNSWRWVFFSSALISLISTPFLLRIPITAETNVQPQTEETVSWKAPWVNAWKLLRERPDFARFQLGFMIGGAGLAVMQTTLPQYFMDVLKLSFTELALALALFKGTGFALASPFWAKWLNRVDIYRLSGWVTLTASIFPVCLFLSQWSIGWLYLGYFMYGIMQGGSELSWNMSGPVFAKDKDSSIYSSVNVMTVGLRGCVVPATGSLIYQATNAPCVLVVGAVLCLLATQRMLHYSKDMWLARSH